MSYSHERDQFIATATKEGLSLDVARKLLRYASTLQRLSEAQCNGDYPYNGSRDNYLHKKDGDPNGREWQAKHFGTCSKCESECAKSQLKQSKSGEKACPDCRTNSLVFALLAGCGIDASPIFSGDPRGAVLVLSTPNYPYDKCGRNGARGLYVPARGN